MNNEKQILTEVETKILSMADKEGYFESPRRISIDLLSEKLHLNPQYVYSKLRAINKKLLMNFIEKMNTSL